MVSTRKKQPRLSKSISSTGAKTSGRSPGRTPNPITILNPKESEVMKQLKFYLDRRFGEKGWIHVPNEMVFLKFLRGVLPKWLFDKIKYMLINFMRSIGVKKDFVDILIFQETPHSMFEAHGCFHIGPNKKSMAIEVKREKGGKVSRGQREWLDYFDSIGWATAVGYGYQDTKNKIEEVYGK